MTPLISVIEGFRSRLRWAIARRRPRLSQREVEARMGVASGFLSHLLGRRRGSHPALDRIVSLAGVLQVRVAWLAFGDGPAWWVLRGGLGDYWAGDRYDGELGGLLSPVRRSEAYRFLEIAEALRVAGKYVPFARVALVAMRPPRRIGCMAGSG